MYQDKLASLKRQLQQLQEGELGRGERLSFSALSKGRIKMRGLSVVSSILC